MSQSSKSSTMRIDLIPEISDVPLSAQPKKLHVPTENARTVSAPASIASARQGYQELFQSIYDGGVITDARGRVKDANRRAMEFFGYDPDEFKRLRVWDFVAGASEELVRTLVENLQSERFTLMQAYCVRKDETIFPAEIAISRVRLPAPHLCFFVRDVTVRRQAEEMLRTEHNALQNAGESILVTNLDSVIEYANPATARLWGYASSAELEGVPLGDLLDETADVMGIIGSLTGETFEWKGDAVARRLGGEKFTVHMNAACSRDSDGDVASVVFSFSDLSAEERVGLLERDLDARSECIAKVREEVASLFVSLREIEDSLDVKCEDEEAAAAGLEALRNARAVATRLQEKLAGQLSEGRDAE